MSTSLDTSPRLQAAVRVRRVMVGYDGSTSAQAALAVAVDEAHRRSVPLHLCTALDLDPVLPQEPSRMSPPVTMVVDAALAGARERLGTAMVTSSSAAGDAALVVLGAVRPGDLVVMGSRSHGLLVRAVLGSASTYVAMHADVPVMVVRQQRARGADDANRVVVGVDGSRLSTAAVGHAAEAAALHDAPLTAVLVVRPREALGLVVGPDDPGLEEARSVLGEALAGVGVDHPDLCVESLVVQGAAVDALLAHAAGARLLVVGSRGRGPLRAALMGSVSRDLLHRSPCDVVVVR